MEYSHGAIIRGDRSEKTITLLFTGDAYADGGDHIRKVLADRGIKAAFFFTGHFYRNPGFKKLIAGLRQDGHYLGAHSDRHLLYHPWENRDSLLVSRDSFLTDLKDNYREMTGFGIEKKDAPYFLPPYEWYNDTIAAWTHQAGLTLINFSPGTRSNADYTTPADPNYISSNAILESILTYEATKSGGLNGFLFLSHIGVHPDRRDKFYRYLGQLIDTLRSRGYRFIALSEMLP